MDEQEKSVDNVKEETTTTGTTPNGRKGFNITALILGIISTICFCAWYIAVPTGIISIIFSIAGRKDEGRGMGIAGMVLGIIGLILTLLWIFVLASILVAAGAYGY